MTPQSPRAFFNEQFRRFYQNRREPYHWQTELFDQFVEGNVPPLIDLPTGTGKTSFMLIWYLALSWMTRAGLPILLPIRLFWAVNRRVVVDQATDEAQGLKAFDALPRGLAVSTLRGQLADNGDWKLDPTRPAIIIGTVDMIGSKLLFSGYGDGPYWRAQHAGLAGVDALFVNDEAHLTPAFAKLVRAVESLEPAAKIPGKKFLFCELSATPGSSTATGFPPNLEMDLKDAAGFAARVTAPKHLHLHRAADKKKAEAKFLELASDESALRTIIFLDSPEAARDVCERLKAAGKERVVLLTGTMRGWERDLLVEHDLFKPFLSEAPPHEPVWLVSTSAGEVGVNLTAERQVTMLAEAEHLIQRFGRLNRFGGPRGDAHVVFTEPTDKEPHKAATLRWLEGLPKIENATDICAKTLYENPAPRQALTPYPAMAELDGWLVDLWSQTTGKAKYPKVEDWLHGKRDDVAETAVAWRQETADLIQALEDRIVDKEDLREAFEGFPVLPHERLAEPSYRVTKKLVELSRNQPGLKILVLGRDGSVTPRALDSLDEKSKVLEGCTVVLPPGVGRLVEGMLSGEIDTDPEFKDKDIADRRGGRAISRRHFFSDEPTPANDEPTDDEKVVLKLPLFDESAEEEGKRYLYYCEARSPTMSVRRYEYRLEDHLKAVAEQARAFAVQLVPELEKTYEWAGRHHDNGKKRKIWQDSMGLCPGKQVAKPFKPPRPKLLGGYRHELGTLAGLNGSRPEEHPELALHLIAAHHGHARPYFHDRAHDTEQYLESRAIVEETPGRFARLSEQWGPWGLAYLEAILKSADGYVSKIADDNYRTQGQAEDESD